MLGNLKAWMIALYWKSAKDSRRWFWSVSGEVSTGEGLRLSLLFCCFCCCFCCCCCCSCSSTKWSKRETIPDPEHEGSSRIYSTFLYLASLGLTFKKSWCIASIDEHPALLLSIWRVPNRLASWSKAKMLPWFPIRLARWDVLFPGAAHASIMWAPRGGLRIWAGKQEALSCSMIVPFRRSGWACRSVPLGNTTRSLKCKSFLMVLGLNE